MKKLMIAAPKSGSGKTTITIALLKALKENSIKTVSFKCGPDYIDPLFHKMVLCIPSYNLDTFFTGDYKTKELFLENSNGFDFALTEGVMGIFDGVGGSSLQGSSYNLAEVCDMPIVMVFDAKGMGAISVSAMIKGFLSYDEKNLIKGVILNKASKPFYEKIKDQVEKETGIKLLGCMPENKDINISSRHLGLVTPSDIDDMDEILNKLYKEFSCNVSLDEILNAAGEELNTAGEKMNTAGEELNAAGNELKTAGEEVPNFSRDKEGKILDNKCNIAIAKDDAFCFLYEENINVLKQNGANIICFSPLKDNGIPKDADAIIIPGGYPEEHLVELSKNLDMFKSIKEAYENKMPIIAECGGFMYLHESIEDKENNSFAMAGVVKGKCFYLGKSKRFGYIEIKEKNADYLGKGESIKGHEFHYYESDNNGDSCVAIKPSNKSEYECVIKEENLWAGFAHLYYPSNERFAKSVIKKAEEYRNKNRG